MEDADEDDDHEHARSVYARSTYPRTDPAHRVEHPYDPNGYDDGTIDSSRTLYADEVEYVMENGRQYCGDYFMPIDSMEQTRQYVIHQVYLKTFNLQLTTVPLEDPSYILDIGTGVGEWAIAMAERYPDCEVFGTDIAPIQPTDQVPFNVEFHIEDAEDEWIRPPDTVDLVHIREMTGAFSDWSSIYQQAYTCIKPGGWLEVVDFDDVLANEAIINFFPEGSAARIVIPGIYEAAQKCGRPRGVEHMKHSRLEEAGFVDIKDSTYYLGIGSKENASWGSSWLFAIVTGIEATCLRHLTKVLGWDPDYTRGLCARVAEEVKALAEDAGRPEGFKIQVRVLTARKPRIGEAVAARWTTAVALGENGEVDYSGGDDSTIGSRSGRTLRSEDTM
ncbi:S-adenosyl-L-methionine-dependent methyltransferase [Podospora aff. communis PSN243]|uniref:S-adenosyl-L-methionine-dependent methyltransferase n=1 Tax=Podospora aff. communis PSN243 TaxID=3040156 RepID=A0AAV9GKC8_9PEZI|nr:S-adenosyl-L-methionine-dependent methyltransferase [Podospora aff. communis PSN243]